MIVATEHEQYPWVAGFDAAFQAADQLELSLEILGADTPMQIRDRIGIFACKKSEWAFSERRGGLITYCTYSHDDLEIEHRLDPTGTDAFRLMHGANDLIGSLGAEVAHV